MGVLGFARWVGAGGAWLQSCAELLEDRAAVSSGAGGRLRRTRCNHSVFPVFFLLLSTAGRQLGLLGKLTELDETAVNWTPDWAQHSPITVQSREDADVTAAQRFKAMSMASGGQRVCRDSISRMRTPALLGRP